MRKTYDKPKFEVTLFNVAERIMADVTGKPDGDNWNAGVTVSGGDMPSDFGELENL